MLPSSLLIWNFIFPKLHMHLLYFCSILNVDCDVIQLCCENVVAVMLQVLTDYMR